MRKTLEQIQAECQLAAETWKLSFEAPLPAGRQFGVWLNLYPIEIVEEAIRVTGTRDFMKEREGKPMSEDDRLRYASAVMRNMKQEAAQ
jgi:hypothetical protein